MFSVCVCVCVCVCVFGSKYLTFFLLRDVFESLNCCWDLWLISMFDCIHFCVFLFFENLFLHFSTASRYLSTARLSIEIFDLPFSTKANAISIHRNFWEFVSIAFDRFSIHRETFCLLDRCLIEVRSIEVTLLWATLDSTSTDKSVEN